MLPRSLYRDARIDRTTRQTHDGMVTTMDAWGVPSSSDAYDPSRRRTGTNVPNGKNCYGTVLEYNSSIVNAPSMPPSTAGGGATKVETVNGRPFGDYSMATECLILSGALDRTLCVFRARYGQGLQVLRRLNVACSPRGMPGALVVGAPAEGGSEDAARTPLEVWVGVGAVGRRRRNTDS